VHHFADVNEDGKRPGLLFISILKAQSIWSCCSVRSL